MLIKGAAAVSVHPSALRLSDRKSLSMTSKPLGCKTAYGEVSRYSTPRPHESLNLKLLIPLKDLRLIYYFSILG